MGPVGDALGIGASLADATATDALAFGAPAPSLAFLSDDIDALTQEFSFNEYEYVSAQRLAMSSQFLTLLMPQDFSNSHSSTPCRSPPLPLKSFMLTQLQSVDECELCPIPSQ
jgi:hypothetical protein